MVWGRSRLWERHISPPVAVLVISAVLPASPSPCEHPRTTATKGGHGHCSCFVPIAISLSSSSAFTSLQPKVPLTLHPARRNPTQLLTFYCFCSTAHAWADEIFSAHPPSSEGLSRGQPGKSCLKPLCLLEVWPLSPTASLQHICCNFPFEHPTEEKKKNQTGWGGVVLLGQAELRQGKKINFSAEQFRFFCCSLLGTEAELVPGAHSSPGHTRVLVVTPGVPLSRMSPDPSPVWEA